MSVLGDVWSTSIYVQDLANLEKREAALLPTQKEISKT
jgi:hypothetical protein